MWLFAGHFSQRWTRTTLLRYGYGRKRLFEISRVDRSLPETGKDKVSSRGGRTRRVSQTKDNLPVGVESRENLSFLLSVQDLLTWVYWKGEIKRSGKGPISRESRKIPPLLRGIWGLMYKCHEPQSKNVIVDHPRKKKYIFLYFFVL